MGREAICDFPRSSSVTAGDLRVLQTQHEGVAGVFGAALAELLRSPVEVSLAGVEQLRTANSCTAWQALDTSTF